MDKTNQPRGLIRYASYKELHHNEPVIPLYKRLRVIIYGLILLLALSGIIYGFTHLSPTEFKVVHQRQPLYVLLSDGSIQNKYTVKLLNKTKNTINIHFEIEGLEGATLHGLADMKIEPGKVIPVTALVRVPQDRLTADLIPIVFKGEVENSSIDISYESMFISPKR
jgi:polyferredoxin